MNTIIAITTTQDLTIEQSDNLAARIKAQAGEGYTVIVLPPGCGIASQPMALARFSEKMDVLDKANPEPLTTLERRVDAAQVERQYMQMAGFMPDARVVATLTSPAGAKVQHVDDAPQEDAPVRYLLLTKMQSTNEQRQFAVALTRFQCRRSGPYRWST